MKALALLLVLAPAHAPADAPGDFRSGAPIETIGRDALQRLTLPFEAYRDARRDLADLRVFNARGEALPIAFAGEPEATREAPPAMELPLFPILAAPSARAANNLDVMVRSNPDGTIVSVQGRPRGAPAPRPVAWLLDASQGKRPMRALVLEWEAGPGTEVARVGVEASDDLKSWRTVASRAPLLRVEHAGQKLSQPKVDLGSLRAKYLRISGESAAFVLRGARAEPDEVVKPAPRSLRVIAATSGAKPGEYLFDLGARLPVEAVRVTLPATNSVAPFTILSREREGAEWRRETSATFYRLVRDGDEIQSPPVEIGRRFARYWSIRLDPRSPGIGAAAPALEVQWRPAQLVFVARGDPPYRLAFGNPDARPAVLALSELIPGYEPRAELKLAEATVGEVRGEARSDDAWRRLMDDVGPRKLLLWAILVAGVLALAWMAWRLQRQLRAGGVPEEGAPRG